MNDDELRKMREMLGQAETDVLRPALRRLAEYETDVIRNDRSRPALVVLFVLEQLRGVVADICEPRLEVEAARGNMFEAGVIVNQTDALVAMAQAAVDAYEKYLKTRVH
jgi:hypothetical protein